LPEFGEGTLACQPTPGPIAELLPSLPGGPMNSLLRSRSFGSPDSTSSVFAASKIVRSLGSIRSSRICGTFS
jgi:hypothetical protein